MRADFLAFETLWTSQTTLHIKKEKRLFFVKLPRKWEHSTGENKTERTHTSLQRARCKSKLDSVLHLNSSTEVSFGIYWSKIKEIICWNYRWFMAKTWELRPILRIVLCCGRHHKAHQLLFGADYFLVLAVAEGKLFISLIPGAFRNYLSETFSWPFHTLLYLTSDVVTLQGTSTQEWYLVPWPK